MSNEIQNRGSSPLARIRKYISEDSVKARLAETLGKRAGAFSNSIINVVRGSNALQKCNPDSVMSAAMIAATMNLPIDPALGQAAIVPYGGQAQFQLMYKGVIQLCIRSGQYKAIHCSEIYKDELKSHNPITGEVKFHDPDTYKMRYAGDKGNVVGHYAHFRLTRGFEKSDYMTHEEVMAHALQYSKAYQYDVKFKKGTSAWSTDSIPMGNKTVLLRLLKKYGVMSLDMQEAFVADNTFDAAQAESEALIDTQTGSEPMDTTFEDPDPAETQESGNEGDIRPGFVQDDEADAKAKAEGQAQKKKLAEAEAEEKAALYKCSHCDAEFDVPETSGKGANAVTTCPECSSPKINAGEEMSGEGEGKYVCKSCGQRFAEPKNCKKGRKTWRGCPGCDSKNYENDGAFDKAK